MFIIDNRRSTMKDMVRQAEIIRDKESLVLVEFVSFLVSAYR